jgi:hypothetical protein
MNPLNMFSQGMFGSESGSLLDIASKLGVSALGLLPVVLGIWKLGIIAQRPGKAGVMLSWNNQMMIKKHRDNSCVADCGHSHSKWWQSRRRFKIIHWGKYAREVKEVRKHRFEILKYRMCDQGCECTHMMGRIIWPSIRLKWPWRKAHEIPLFIRTNNIDPITIDVFDSETGKLQQRRFEGTLHWKVSDDVFDDAPLRADHEIGVRDLDVTVVQRVTRAANQAENRYQITKLSQEVNADDPDDIDNRKAIYNHVNDFCKGELFKLGVIMFDFELRESARTGQQVLADALTNGGGPSDSPDGDPDKLTQLKVVAMSDSLEQQDPPA